MTSRQTTDNLTASSSPNTVVETAAISDRGLSEKRPVNEDSFLADAERRIFAVADGVGGAQSGEVASQTAIETLDEAFRHHKAGDDAEDLMEIAFQRANLAIHQMSREHHKLAMMATTIVALYLDGRRATIGHVGDSRLYHLTAAGELRRETADHSVVEEEVRAGRMTESEAQHHPSRNVISRALGAEANVEADMRTVEIEQDTLFLLCSDGITRHVSDEELRELLTSESNLHRICDELKRRCYERGAEDNLTAVIVRVGERGAERSLETTRLDSAQTLTQRRPAAYATGELTEAFADFHTAHSAREHAPHEGASASPSFKSAQSEKAPTTPTRIEVPTSGSTEKHDNQATRGESSRVSAAHSEKFSPPQSRAWSKLLFLSLIVLVCITGAFAVYQYSDGNLKFNRTPSAEPVPESGTIASSQTSPAPAPSDTVLSDTAPTHAPTYTEQRAAVDEAPQIMMRQMWSERGGAPLEHTDPKFLYLYGRALYRMGNDREAQAAFRRAIEIMRQQGASSATTRESAELREAEAHLRTDDPTRLQRASELLDEMIARTNLEAEQMPAPSSY